MDAPPAPVRPPAGRRRILKPAIGIALLVIVFGWLLPQFIDYEEVWDAVAQLDGWEVIVLVGLGSARIPTEAIMYRAFLPGLGLRRGSEAYLSSNFAGQLLPPPTASVVQHGYFRGGGFTADESGLAAFGSFLFPTIGRFVLPLLAVVLLLVTGEVNGSVAVAGALSLVITAAAGAGGYVFLRSDRSARWIGSVTQRPLSWMLVKFKRSSIEDGPGKATRLRTQALAVLREGWALGSIGVGANLLLTYLILLASLRFVGVSSTELSATDAFAAFAIAFWAGAVIPITGSGLGVVDAVLIAMLIELSGASDDSLVAAALLWRVFYSILPLPLGALTMSRFRKAEPGPAAVGGIEAT